MLTNYFRHQRIKLDYFLVYNGQKIYLLSSMTNHMAYVSVLLLKVAIQVLTCTHYFFRCAQDSWPYSESDIINSTNVIFGYTTAFYFGVTTMTQTGYGDLLPRSVAEQVLIIFTMCIGFIVWNICVVTITANLMNNSFFKLVMYMHTYSTWYS